jgi:hypothetical protein
MTEEIYTVRRQGTLYLKPQGPRFTQDPEVAHPENQHSAKKRGREALLNSGAEIGDIVEVGRTRKGVIVETVIGRLGFRTSSTDRAHVLSIYVGGRELEFKHIGSVRLIERG